MKTLTTFTFLILHFINYSQINISESKRTETLGAKMNERLVVYDSIENLVYFQDYSNYKKYIGQQLYLVPLQNNRPSLYSEAPVLLSIDKMNENLVIKSQYEYNTIFTNIYKPIHYKTKNADPNNYRSYTEVFITNSDSICDNYYTLLDVIYGDELMKTLNKWETIFSSKKTEINELKTRKKTWENSQKTWIHQNQSIDLNYSPTQFSFVLRNDKTGDTVYAMNLNKNEILNFVLVPYFVKQKKLYENKVLRFKGNKVPEISYDSYNMLEDLSKGNYIDVEVDSKWFCEEVTLLKPSYSMVYILKNEKGESIATPTISDFSYEEIFLKEKMEKEHVTQKRAEQEKLQQENEIVNKENHRKECINKYGEKYGELVALGKLEIGMTMDMCRDSWGTPTNLYEEKTNEKTYVIWSYFKMTKLYFLNNKLTKIENKL